MSLVSNEAVGRFRTEKNCTECGASFVIPTWEFARHRTCSKPCGNARLSRLRRGNQNPMWKGAGASYKTIHDWLARNLVKRGVCDACGSEARTDWAFLYHPDPPTREAGDYREMCRSCHVSMDYANGHRSRVRPKRT